MWGSCSVTRPGTEYVLDGGAGGITASTDTKLRYRLESRKRLRLYDYRPIMEYAVDSCWIIWYDSKSQLQIITPGSDLLITTYNTG